MAKIGNKEMNVILEGLHEGRYDYDEFDEMNIDDTLVILKRGRLEDEISVGLEKRYKKKFEKFGDCTFNVNVELTDMDEYNLEDVADEVTIGVFFYNAKLNYAEVVKEIKKTIRSFKGFNIKRDKEIGDYIITAGTQEEIIDLFYDLEKEGCNIKNFYKIVDAEDIRNSLRKANAEYRADREYLEREYRRSKL